MPWLEAGDQPRSTFPRLTRPAVSHHCPLASNNSLFAATPTPECVKSHIPFHSSEPKISFPKPLLTILLPLKSLCSQPLSCTMTPSRSVHRGKGFPHRPVPLPPWPVPGLLTHSVWSPLLPFMAFPFIRVCLRPIRTCLSSGPFLDR